MVFICSHILKLSLKNSEPKIIMINMAPLFVPQVAHKGNPSLGLVTNSEGNPLLLATISSYTN